MRLSPYCSERIEGVLMILPEFTHGDGVGQEETPLDRHVINILLLKAPQSLDTRNHTVHNEPLRDSVYGYSFSNPERMRRPPTNRIHHTAH